ncbi:MAG: PTS sugar transporter subunit IIA [Candidatus Puniceispirillaceae bacterium]|jgi:PTS system nitrogen regulatory IIA component
MPLLDFLPTDGVMTDLSASSKKQLIENIAEHAGSLTGLSARAVFDALMQRERLGSTAIGGGTAIPHAVFADLAHSVVIISILEKPVDFDSNDKKPVDIICTILGPDQADCDHLKLVSTASKRLADDSLRDGLRGARTASDVRRCLQPSQATAA